jgi:hypothetical protein
VSCTDSDENFEYFIETGPLVVALIACRNRDEITGARLGEYGLRRNMISSGLGILAADYAYV